MRTCKCEHWEVCPTCQPDWFDREGNRLPPEPTPLQAANKTIEDLKQQLATKDAEIERLKTVPMKYRRMAFNAQLQDENAQLCQQLAQSQADLAETERRRRNLGEQLAESNLNLPKDIRGAFVTEYIYIDDNEGPTLVRLPKADWPEWASSLLK